MSEPAAAGIRAYLEELRNWGARVNLVGSLEPEALARHVEDSLAAARALPRDLRVADLGSGAGFPGLPVAIERPDLAITLVEIRERRVHFLRHVVRTLGLGNATVLRVDLAGPPPERWDRVLLRAVAPPARAAALGRPWVADEGEIWVWTGPDAGDLSGFPALELASGGSIRCCPAAEVSRGTPV